MSILNQGIELFLRGDVAKGQFGMPASNRYIHGSGPPEQGRLSRLNELLNAASLRELDLKGGEQILDVGSGIAQLSRPWPESRGREPVSWESSVIVIRLQRPRDRRPPSMSRISSSSEKGMRSHFRSIRPSGVLSTLHIRGFCSSMFPIRWESFGEWSGLCVLAAGSFSPMTTTTCSAFGRNRLGSLLFGRRTFAVTTAWGTTHTLAAAWLGSSMPLEQCRAATIGSSSVVVSECQLSLISPKTWRVSWWEHAQ